MCAFDPRPAPPQRCADTPMPVLIGPGVGSPVAWRLSQPNAFAPRAKYSAHIALGAAGGRFFTRNATGSIFTRSASSSIRISVRKQPCGCPGARIARCWPALMKTSLCVRLRFGKL